MSPAHRASPQPFEPDTGVVWSFDEPRGVGVITTASGVELPFHCTAITDGTRTISVGERVRFQVVPGRAGRWEAARIEAG